MELSLHGSRYRWLIAIALGLIPLQGSLLDVAVASQLRPDMALVAVYVAGFVLTPFRATLLGLISGLLVDLLSGAALGISAFSKMLAGMLAASGRRILFLNRALAHSAMLFVLSCIDGFVTSLFLVYFYKSYFFTTAMVRMIILQAAYTALAGTVIIIAADPAIALTRKIRKWLVKDLENAVSGI